MKKRLIDFFKFLLFLGVGVVILYFVYQNQSAKYLEECLSKGVPAADCPSLMKKLVTDFKSVNYFWILMVLVAFMISNWSRAIRWKMLMKPLGYRPKLSNAFLSVIIAYMANLVLPRIGEVVRAGTISRYERMAPEKVMGTIVVDRVVDLLTMLLVIGLALIFEFDILWDYISTGIQSGESSADLSLWQSPLFWFFLAGLAATFTIYLFRSRLKQSLLYLKMAKILVGFAEGLRSIGKLDRPWWFLFHSLNIWFMYFLMTYLCFFAFAPTSALGMGAGLMVFVFGALGILIPSPGGMGTFQLLVVQALGMYNIAGDDAFSFANILFFSVQIGCNVIVGLISWMLLPILNKNYQPVHKLPENVAPITS